MVRLYAGILSALLALALAAVPAAAQPMEMTLAKTDIGASPEQVFALIEDFRNWSRWSPHEKADPAVQHAFGGAKKGQGAIYRWDGAAVGQGEARITRSDPHKALSVDLDLQKPVAGRLTLQFTFEGTGAVTKMTVATKGDAAAVKYAMDRFFSGSLMRLACAVEEAPKPLCTFLMKDVGKP